jgi:L-asparagine transporter-like permease
MTNVDRDFYLRLLVVVLQLAFAWLIVSQVLLRKRDKAFISQFEKRYAAATSIAAAVLMLVDAAMVFMKDDSASGMIYSLTTVAVLAHFLGVVFIHLRTLQRNGQLKMPAR